MCPTLSEAREELFADELHTPSWLSGEKSVSWTRWSWTKGERRRGGSAIVGCGCAVSEDPLGREWKGNGKSHCQECRVLL